MAMNKTKKLFPLGIATGAAHCNRKVERETLKLNLVSGSHTWLWARLWDDDAPPTTQQVGSIWQTIVAEDTSMVSYSVRNLSATQRAMLLGIARAGTVLHPTGRRFLTSARLSASTGSSAKEVLEANDLIRQNNEEQWELVDPVMAAYLRAHV